MDEFTDGICLGTEAWEGSRCHNVVAGCRVPSSMVVPLCDTVALVLVKVAVQPLSHNWPTDMRLPVASDGKRWTAVAGAGS